jgi:hypothetical protein
MSVPADQLEAMRHETARRDAELRQEIRFAALFAATSAFHASGQPIDEAFSSAVYVRNFVQEELRAQAGLGPERG